MNIGANIRNFRKENKLTLKELGYIAGISEQAISKYERGLRVPNAYVAYKIAKALEVTLEELITGYDRETAVTTIVRDIKSYRVYELLNELKRRGIII